MVHSYQRMMVIHCIMGRSCLICFPGKELRIGEVSCQNHLQFQIIVPYPQLGTMACGVFLYVSAAYFSLSDVYLCKKYKNFLIFFSRKLLLLRKRNTVYTRSKHGFSLRKSKVLSFGGSSLKWSKSIDRYSKKANEVSWAGWMAEAKFLFFFPILTALKSTYVHFANARVSSLSIIFLSASMQEATLAVAAVERKNRERRGAAHVASPTKSRNSSSRKLAHSMELHRICSGSGVC